MIAATQRLESLPPAKPVAATDSFGWNRKDWLRIVLLVALTVGFWCYLTGRTSFAAWQVPLEYGLMGADADAQGVFSMIKAAADGEFHPLMVQKITRVGAPFYGNWSDFPTIEEWQLYLPGVLARWIGLFAAANVAVMVAHVLASVCFYTTARLMNCKCWWAFAGGITFGFAQFTWARSIHHLNVTNCWYIPICLLIAGWITRDEMGPLWRRRYSFSLLAAFLIGMQNPYYTNMFLQLAILGAFYQYFRQGWRPIQQAAGIVAAAACGFFLMNLDTFIYRLEQGANPGAMVREYRWLELSALKFVDLFIPPQNHNLLGWIGSAYYGPAGREFDPAIAKMVSFPGEVPASCYLGILGIACLIWLAVISVRRLVAETGRPLPLAAWQVLWILAYAAVGGLNCLAGLLGATLFRSSNRYCIFILPILLLFAIKRLSRKSMESGIEAGTIGLCILLALWDQMPTMAQTRANLTELSHMVDSDRQFTKEIEENLPKGAMVFQLPIIDYPESPSFGVSSSEQFRPYLHSKDLRFSFGAVKGRPWLAWQRELGEMSFPDSIRRMESLGFAAVYVNRRGFQDRGESILNSFKELGYSKFIESKAADIFCVLIHSAAHPVLPSDLVP